MDVPAPGLYDGAFNKQRSFSLNIKNSRPFVPKKKDEIKGHVNPKKRNKSLEKIDYRLGSTLSRYCSVSYQPLHREVDQGMRERLAGHQKTKQVDRAMGPGRYIKHEPWFMPKQVYPTGFQSSGPKLRIYN